MELKIDTKVIEVFIILLIVSIGFISYARGDENRLESSKIENNIQSIVGVIENSETFFTANDYIYKVLSLSDGNDYVIDMEKKNMTLTKGMQIKIDISKGWGKYKGEYLYEEYPDAITAKRPKLLSIPMIINGEQKNIQIKE